MKRETQNKQREKQIIQWEAACDGGLLSVAKAHLAHLPGGTVKSYLEHRMLSVDGAVTSQYDYPVKAGQTITVGRAGESTYKVPLPILYEDRDLLAVNKPAGLLSVASDGERERTALRMLRDSGAGPIFVVHRLDKDTSGVLLFARSPEVRDALQENWEEVKRREYLAVCEGVFSRREGRCESYLLETSTHLVYSSADGSGKRAVTNYQVTKENEAYSHLKVWIETGRKNQIRVHMKELGHPIVGDKKYGATGSPLGRLGLHASRLELDHPVTGAALTIKAPAGRRFHLPRPEGAPRR